MKNVMVTHVPGRTGLESMKLLVLHGIRALDSVCKMTAGAHPCSEIGIYTRRLTGPRRGAYRALSAPLDK